MLHLLLNALSCVAVQEGEIQGLWRPRHGCDMSSSGYVARPAASLLSVEGTDLQYHAFSHVAGMSVLSFV